MRTLKKNTLNMSNLGNLQSCDFIFKIDKDTKLGKERVLPCTYLGLKLYSFFMLDVLKHSMFQKQLP